MALAAADQAGHDVITGVSLYFASWGTGHYIFRVFSEVETPFCTLSTVISVRNTNFSVHLIHSICGPPNVTHVITCTGGWPPDVHHSVTYHFTSCRPAVTSLREFPHILPAGGPIIRYFGCSPSLRPRFLRYSPSFL